MNSSVDFYFEKDGKWKKEIAVLRKIILDCGLQEELKWGHPCYVFEGCNVVLIHSFKEYCALLFFKGALMDNQDHLLVQQTKNVQSARQIRFTSEKEILEVRSKIKASLFEAIEIERSGLKVSLKKTAEYDMPAEFENKLAKSARLKKAYQSLTPGRQRGYLLHFSSAKQAATRQARIEKCIPLIMKGKGLNDR